MSAGGQLPQEPIEEQIQQNYAVGSIASIQPTDHGGVWMLETHRGRFVAKLGQREDHLRLHLRAQNALAEQGLRCNLVIPTTAGGLLTPQGLALFTWVAGESVGQLDAPRTDAALQYLQTYLQALGTAHCTDADFIRQNGWDDAQSLEYLLTQLPRNLATMPLQEQDRAVIQNAIDHLRIHRPALQRRSRQLIHADLGPDNFLFDGNQVTAVIDFTPADDHMPYAVAQFIYWNDLYPNPCVPQEQLLERFSAVFPDGAEQELWMAVMLRAALYRVVGPLLQMVQSGAVDHGRLRRRIACLKAVLP